VGCTPAQPALQRIVKDERVAAGVEPLLPAPHANAKAPAWAAEMARTEMLRHSKLGDGMPADFLKIGENVGRGPGIGKIHLAFMDSPGHQANVLDPAYGWIGTGFLVA